MPQTSVVGAVDLRRARLRKFKCDRIIQRNKFVDSLEQALKTSGSWPQIIVALGTDDDCVETLVERLCVDELPWLLKAFGLKPEMVTKRLEWPIHDFEISHGDQAQKQILGLEKAVAKSMGLPPSAPRKRIANALNALGAAVVFEYDIDGETFDSLQFEVLRLEMHWWRDLGGEIKTPYPVIAMPWFGLRKDKLSWIPSRDRTAILSKQLVAIAERARLAHRFHVLPPLGRVTRQDAIDWLHDNLHQAGELPADYSQRLTKFFSGTFGRSRTVTMEQASDFFGELIKEMQISKYPAASEGYPS